MTEPWLEITSHFPPDQWAAGWTTYAGPDFRSHPATGEQATAMRTLSGAVGLENAAWAEQVHGGTVLRVDRPGLAGQADGLWTDVPGLGVVGRSADCPLILVGGFRGDGTGVWGFAHASWRSTVRNISSRLVLAMSAAGAETETMTACIGPSAGPCCYEVGADVLDDALARLGPEVKEFFSPADDKWILDLWAANKDQLHAAGISADSIYMAGECTICGGSKYPSYRREGARAGRFAAIIGRPKRPQTRA